MAAKTAVREDMAPAGYDRRRFGRFNPPKRAHTDLPVIPVTQRTMTHERVKRTYDVLCVGDRVQVYFNTRHGSCEITCGVVVPNGTSELSVLSRKHAWTKAEVQRIEDLLASQAAMTPDPNYLEVEIARSSAFTDDRIPHTSWAVIPRADIMRLRYEHVGESSQSSAQYLFAGLPELIKAYVEVEQEIERKVAQLKQFFRVFGLMDSKEISKK